MTPSHTNLVDNYDYYLQSTHLDLISTYRYFIFQEGTRQKASCHIYDILPIQVTYFPILFTVASQHRGVVTLGQIFWGEPPPMRLAPSSDHDCFLHTFCKIVFGWWFARIAGLVQFLMSYGLKVEIKSCTFVNFEQGSCNSIRTGSVELKLWISDQYQVLQASLQLNMRCQDIILYCSCFHLHRLSNAPPIRNKKFCQVKLIMIFRPQCFTNRSYINFVTVIWLLFGCESSPISCKVR